METILLSIVVSIMIKLPTTISVMVIKATTLSTKKIVQKSFFFENPIHLMALW
jgi:hypothetical protein